MPSLSRAARQQLKDWQLAGLTHIPRATVIPSAEPGTVPVVPEESIGESRVVEPAPQSRMRTLQEQLTKPVAAPPAPAVAKASVPAAQFAALNLVPNTAPLPQRQSELQEVAACVANCTRCPHLASTRTQTVFGVGNPLAKILFIGEAPGADEDATGIPFVGKAGQLLTKIIEACGWQRDEIYICNVLRCRPPGNRTPNEQEAANCREYLDQQIRIVDPEYIVCWGSCAAQNLLATKDAIGKMRQRFYTYGRAKVLCTYHPSYLLRNPAAKKPVWEDMKFLMAEMGVTPPQG